MAKTEEEEYIIQPPEKFSLNLKELWQYRELFYFFTWRDIKVRYKQTFFGFAWAVLQPLLITIVFVLFFADALQISTDNIPAPIFYFSGLIFWNLFSSGVTGAANSMISNANIIKKIYFPRLIIPLASVLSAVFDFLMSMVIFILFFLYYKINGVDLSISNTIFFFLLAFLLTLLFSVGIGVLIASLNVKYRDFKYVIPFLIQFLFFVTPILYPLSVISSPMLKRVLSLNPMSGVTSLARGGLLDRSINWDIIGWGTFFALILFLLSIYNFRRTEAYYADLA